MRPVVAIDEGVFKVGEFKIQSGSGHANSWFVAISQTLYLKTFNPLRE